VAHSPSPRMVARLEAAGFQVALLDRSRLPVRPDGRL
jgi:hypothetical protein